MLSSNISRARKKTKTRAYSPHVLVRKDATNPSAIGESDLCQLYEVGIDRDQLNQLNESDDVRGQLNEVGIYREIVHYDCSCSKNVNKIVKYILNQMC